MPINMPFERGVRTWLYDAKTNAVTMYVDEVGVITLYDIDPQTGYTLHSATFIDEKSANDFIEEHYTYSQPSNGKDVIPGGLLLAKIEPLGYSTGNAYDLHGKLVEHYQYTDSGEEHSVASATDTWKLDSLTPNKRYEVFVTWKNNSNNSSKVVFSGYQDVKKEPVFSTTVNQTRTPIKHVVGSYAEKTDYQSIGLITAQNQSVVVKAKLAEKVSLAAVRQELTVSEIAAKYKVNSVNVAKWKSQLIERMSELFADGRGKKPPASNDVDIADLLQEVGRLTMENDYLRCCWEYRKICGVWLSKKIA